MFVHADFSVSFGSCVSVLAYSSVALGSCSAVFAGFSEFMGHGGTLFGVLWFLVLRLF